MRRVIRDLLVGWLWLQAAALPARAQNFDLVAALRQAAPGEEIRVPAGVYRGPIVIDKAVRLIGEPGAVLDGGGVGDVVRITAADVTLRGFVIRNTGIALDQENAGITVLAARASIEDNDLDDVLFGVYLRNAPDCRIVGNRIAGKNLDIARRGDGIRLWYSHKSRIVDNVVHDGRDAVMWFSDDVQVRGNRITSSRYGLHFMYSHRGLLEDNHLENNSVGTYLMYSRDSVLRRNTMIRNRGPSGYGLGLKDVDNLLVEDNQLVSNRVGLYVDNSPQEIDAHNRFRRNVFAHNDVGIAFQPSVQRNLFAENTFLENLEQVAILGTGRFRGNLFTVDGRGNFWSDYAGYDADGDGLGDLPYRAQSLFEDLMQREPRMRLFLYSPAQQAIELAARAFPAVRPQPKLSDEAPLVRPVPLQVAPLPAQPRAPMGVLSAGLLALACAAGLGGWWGLGARSRAARCPHVAGPRLGAGQESCAMIRVSNLTKRFGSFVALDDLTFTVAAGEAVALWGPNGAGKTTAIRCVLGLLSYEGQVVVNGHDAVRQGKRARASLGYVPQELSFYDDWRASEFLRFCAQLKAAPRNRIDAVLEMVDLADQGRKRIGQLSGGMKQRLALAAGLLAEPPLLVLDEITSNIDRDGRDMLLDLLARLKRQGKTILFTSHRLEEVERLADRVLVLEAGRLQRDCTPQQLTGRLDRQTRLRLLADPEVA